MYIRHGDKVSLRYVGIDNTTGFLYNYGPLLLQDRVVQRWSKGGRKVTVENIEFRIYKDPYYKSPNDIVLTGYGVRLVRNESNHECIIDPKTKQLKCAMRSASSKLKIGMRILDKHGLDKVKLQDPHNIKIRPVGSVVDCSGAGLKKPIQCKTKNMHTEEYGFALYKV